MAFTVKDLFEIPITKNFRLVAGEDGLDRPVRGIEILDFEFTRGVKTERHDLFNKNTLILTSLVFAKDDPLAILDAVKTLFSINVSCLAYKPVIFSDLPREVIEYADSAGFPILEFGGDEFRPASIGIKPPEQHAVRPSADCSGIDAELAEQSAPLQTANHDPHLDT